MWVVTLDSTNTCGGEQVLELLSLIELQASIKLELWRRLGIESHLVEVTKESRHGCVTEYDAWQLVGNICSGW